MKKNDVVPWVVMGLLAVALLVVSFDVGMLRRTTDRRIDAIQHAQSAVVNDVARLLAKENKAATIQVPVTPDGSEKPPAVTVSELSSYIPASCPPADTYPTTARNGAYTLIELGCGDSNWSFGATLVRDAVTQQDLVAYVLSTSSLVWQVAGGSKHVLTTIGDTPWDSFTDFGGSQPVTVLDLTLDGKRLNLLKPYVVDDGGLGEFQGVKFAENADYSGGTLTINKIKYTVDFKNATVVKTK